MSHAYFSDILQKIFTGTAIRTTATLDASDIEIGAVEIKNAGDDTRATVGAQGLEVTVKGNVTLSDPKTFIGLTTTTLGASPAFIGIVTVTNRDRTITGNVTLSDAKTFIGLVTNVPAYGSNITVFTGIYSATGANTVFIAPASNRFWLKSLHIASLGRAEVEIRSGATTLIPFTGLATTGGYVHDFTDMGLPSRAQADAFVLQLNGGTTVSVMASAYFQP